MSFISNKSFNNLVPISTKDSRTIVFIDSNFANWESIAQKIIFQARVIIVGSEDDGVKEISKILHDSNCLEVHIISSGFPGCIYLGNSELSLDTLATYSLEMKKWFVTNKSLNRVKLPSINLYGLNLNMGDAGEEFITKLTKITGARIHTYSNIYKSQILNS